MSLAYPLDILVVWPGWTTSFSLRWRKEYSSQTRGRRLSKDMGPPLWSLAAVSRTLSANELDHWRARLDALEGGGKTFKGYKLSRVYPIAYPKGAWPTGGAFSGETAAIHTIGTGYRSLRVDGLPAAFKLSIGDMLSIDRGSGRRDLHEVVEAATASGAGLTPEFEVRPHIWTGAAVDDPVSVIRPWCLMELETVQADADPQTGRGVISFTGIEVR